MTEHHSPSAQTVLEKLGSKPSISEERGLEWLDTSDINIFSPGISTAGFAEIRMAQAHPLRKIIATTIDEKGLAFARQIITELGLETQIETKLENIVTGELPENFFDFVYARLILHYLSVTDLETVLQKLADSLKHDGKIFIVVRSEKNIPTDNEDITYDPNTKMTSIPHYRQDGSLRYLEVRYFHSPESIKAHLEQAGFAIISIDEYEEQLYTDFMREELSDTVDHVIEVKATKKTAI